MAQPTVIRHLTRGNEFVQIITTGGRGPVYLQRYNFYPKNGYITVLKDERAFTSEEIAVSYFDLFVNKLTDS